MMNKQYYTCEEAFIIALQNCDDNDMILEAVKKIKEDCLVGSNQMDAYNEFVVKNSNLKYCYGCQSYHDSNDTIFEKDGYCKFFFDGIVALNESLYKQGEKRREEYQDIYYHR